MKPIGALLFGLIFGGAGLAVFLHAGRNEAFGLVHIVPGLFVLFGSVLLWTALRGFIDAARLRGSSLRVDPKVTDAGEAVRVTLVVRNEGLVERVVRFALVEQRHDEGWSDEREIVVSAKIQSGLLQAHARIDMPQDASAGTGTSRWLVRAEIAGLSYAPLEQSIDVRPLTIRRSGSGGLSALPSQSLATSSLPRRDTPLLPELRPASPPLEWAGSQTATRVLGAVLLVFGVGFAYAPLRNLRLPRDLSRWFELGELLFHLPFVVGGLVVALLGLVVLTLRTHVRVSQEGINSTWTTLFIFSRRQHVAPNDVQALRPTVTSRTTTGGGASTYRYSLGVQTAQGVSSLETATSKSVDSAELRELAHRVAAALGRHNLAYDPTPATANRGLSSHSSAPTGERQTWFSGKLRTLLGAVMAMGFVGFALMFASAWMGSNNDLSETKLSDSTSATAAWKSVATELVSASKLDDVTANSAVGIADASVAMTAGFAPLPESTRSLIEPSGSRFSFADKAGSIKVVAAAQWNFSGDTLSIRFERVDIDYASISCQWSKCEALQHVRLQLKNVAHEGATDDESQSWTSEPIRMDPPIAFGERRTLRTLSFEVPLLHGVSRDRLARASLPFVTPRVELGTMSADGNSSVTPLGLQRGLLFATSRVPQGRALPCARAVPLNYLVMWDCPVESERAVLALKGLGALNAAQTHPLWQTETLPLHFAVERGDVDTVARLLSAGANANQLDRHGETPLGVAVWRGQHVIAKTLLNAGAQAELIRRFDDGQRNRSPLHSAVYECDPAMATLLLAHGADPMTVADAGWSALALSLVYPQRTAVAEAIIAAREIDVNVPIPFPSTGWASQGAGSSPFLIAATYNSANTVRMLMKHGGDPKRPGPWGFPVGHFAAYFGHVETLEAMRQSGVDLLQPIARDRPHAGGTYLMHTVHGGKQAAIEYMLKLGADPKQKDAEGRDAIDHAMNYKHFAIAAKLKAGWLKN